MAEISIEKFKTKPYKHQLECLNKFGRRKYFALLADMGTGKAQPLWSKVLTPSGFIEIGKLRIGDEVFAVDGSVTTIIGVHHQGIKEVFKIEFGDGGKTHCCKEHLWLTSNSQERQAFKKGKLSDKYSVKSLEQILDKTHDAAGNAIHQIPVCAEIKFNKAHVAIDPYILGVLLGDGCIKNAASFTNSNEFIIDEIKNRLDDNYEVSSNKNNHRIVMSIGNRTKFGNKYTNNLLKLNLLGKLSSDKFIPEQYLINDISVTLPLLQGLLDTDGTVDNGIAVFSTTSEQLANGIAFITRSLGGIAKIKIRKNCGYYKDGIKTGCKNSYNVRINLPDNICPFKLPRKKELWKPTKKYVPNQRTIKFIESAGEEECVCISVAHESKLYITDDHIVTHNTWVIINNAADLWSSGDCDSVLVFAPSGVHTNWTRLEFPKHMPDWVRYKAVAWSTSTTKMYRSELDKLYAPNGCALRVLTMNWESLQHKSGIEEANRFAKTAGKLMIVCDESDAIKNPTTTRCKELMKLKKYSSFRRIMSGTPINNAPFDAFSQFSFLDENILQTTSFYAFKAEYAEMLPSENRVIQKIAKTKTPWLSHEIQQMHVLGSDILTLINKSRSEQLITAANNIALAIQTSDYESCPQLCEKLRSLFNPAKQSPAKTEVLKLMSRLDTIISSHTAKVSRASSSKRMPQIVDVDKKTGKKKFKNLDRLSKLIAPHSFRVEKKDCLDLPEKIYKTLFFDLTKEQKEIYKKAKDECRLEFEGEITPFSKLVAVSKLAQITSGYYNHPLSKDPVRIPGDNPKLDLLESRVESIVNAGEKVIIWARYTVEIKDIAERLKIAGYKTVEYYGEVGKAERVDAIEAFENGDADIFIGNQQAGGTGITLVSASYVIYFSNNFSLRDRLQSEDRAHRIGQTKNVTYINIVAQGTIDELVVKCLMDKQDVADTIITKGLKLFSD